MDVATACATVDRTLPFGATLLLLSASLAAFGGLCAIARALQRRSKSDQEAESEWVYIKNHSGSN